MTNDGSSAIKLSEKLQYLLVGIIAFTVLFLVKAEQISGMSIGFANSVASGSWGFHPHHLLFGATIDSLYRLFGSTGCDAICIGQLHSIFWGVITVLSVYAISLRALESVIGAIAAAVATIISHGFIVFATQLEPYVPILGMISFLTALILLHEESLYELKYGVIFFGVLSLALLFHQAMVLFLVPLGYAMITVRGRSGFAYLLALSTVIGVFVLTIYAVVFWTTYPSESLVDFYHWIMYYSVISDESHGTLKEFFGRKLIKTAKSVTQLYVVLPLDRFPIGSAPNKLLISAVSLVQACIFLWNIVQVWKGKEGSHFRIFMLVWWSTLGLFFFWWHESVYKFFIPIITPTVILGAMTIKDIFRYCGNRGIWKTVLVAGLVTTSVLVVGLNLYSTVVPLASSKGPIYDQAKRFSDAMPAECNAYSMRYLSGILAYYFKETTLPFNLMFRKHYYSSRDPAVAETLRVKTSFEDERCAIIPLYWVSKEYFVNRTKQAIGRYLDPEDWSKFIEWFFDVKPVEGSAQITYNEFQIIEGKGGERYLILDRTSRIDAFDLNLLLDEIQRLYKGSSRDAFGGIKVGRFRHLAFGYN